MKFRLLVIFLLSLLFASFSFNLLHYDALLRAEQQMEFDKVYYPTLLNKLHERIGELEN